MDYKKFAFDLDGTIIDKKGNIRAGFINLIQKIMTTVENPQIVICTGNNNKYAENIIKKINESLIENFGDDAKKIVPTIISFGGAQITYINGFYLREPLSLELVQKIEYYSKLVDKKAVILINTQDGYHYKQPNLLSKDRATMGVLKLAMPLLGASDFQVSALKDEDYEKCIENKKVLSMEILSLDFGKKQLLLKTLQDQIPECSFSNGTTIQVSPISKCKTLETVCNNLEEVVYFGDGYNDINLLEKCGLSFAFGDKTQVLYSADYAIKDFDDANNYLFNNLPLTEISQETRKYAEINETKKLEKRKQGRIKYTLRQTKKALIGNKENNENNEIER